MGRRHGAWLRGRAAGPLGLDVSFRDQALACTGTRNFLYLEAVPSGGDASPLLGLSLLTHNVRAVGQKIFEVSWP